jgi:hypothetical protein
MEKGNLLAAKGDSDLYQIGHRLAVRYKDFLDQHPYDANTYEFQSSSKARCSQSAYAFSVGFFEGRITADPGATNAEKDKYKLPVQPIDIETLPIVRIRDWGLYLGKISSSAHSLCVIILALLTLDLGHRQGIGSQVCMSSLARECQE